MFSRSRQVKNNPPHHSDHLQSHLLNNLKPTLAAVPLVLATQPAAFLLCRTPRLLKAPRRRAISVLLMIRGLFIKWVLY